MATTVLSPFVLIVTCALVLAIKWYQSWRLAPANTLGLSYAPGPRPWPIVGNYFQVPAKHPWFTYTEWSRQYGDIMHIRLLAEHVIIINSAKIVDDLLEERSNIYSDRPPFHMLKLMGYGFNFAFKPYGSEWRMYRRLFHQVFRTDNITEYLPTITEKSRELLVRLLRTPDDFMNHILHYAAANTMLILYGYKIAEEHDRFIDILERATRMMSDSSFPGAAVLDIIPEAKELPSWLPGMGFKSYARKCVKLVTEMQDAPFNFVKSNIATRSGVKCFTSQLLGRLPTPDGSHALEEAIKGVAGVGYNAGADTTVGAIDTFFLAMTLYPDVQLKAQEEVERVVGTGRLPGYDDRAMLPYVEAVLWEVLRWRPVTPLSVSHATTEADTYDGYFIPKGATVVMNTWALHMDGRVYDEPERFKPERFFYADGTLNKEAYPVTSFGAGRRICPGRHFADAAIWIVLVSVLASFKISKTKDQVHIQGEYTDGLVVRPLPFECSIKPRSVEAQNRILETTALAESEVV